MEWTWIGVIRFWKYVPTPFVLFPFSRHCFLSCIGSRYRNRSPANEHCTGDVVTTPTLPMLLAIIETTLLDDVFREDPTTISLEQHIAALTGHEAGAFVLSGTMANQVALQAHLTSPPNGVL
jgi:hypothetical protein